MLYSAARETLTNVIKHARAHHIWIELEYHEGLASLRVSDDGVGISEAAMAQKAQEGHIGWHRFAQRHWRPGDSSTCARHLPEPKSLCSIRCGRRIAKLWMV